MAPRNNINALTANRRQAELEELGMDLSSMEARHLEAWLATARAAAAAATLLQEALPALQEIRQMAVEGARRSDRGHKLYVRLTSQVARLDEAA